MNFTEDQKILINNIFEKHVAMQSQPISDEEIVDTVNKFWAKLNKPLPKIYVFDTPLECKDACINDGMEIKKFHIYWSMWLASYAAAYEFAKTLKIEFDEENLELFNLWTRNCSFVLFNDDIVYASRKLTAVHFNNEGQLHSTNSPAAYYGSLEKNNAYGLWFINGVPVTKQIVMAPETQTTQEILNEVDEEVKRIRIERYGWAKFLNDINAKIIEQNINDIEGTKECLVTWESNGVTYKALIVVCPSTGKEFILEVNNTVTSCFEAQMYISHGLNKRIILAT